MIILFAKFEVKMLQILCENCVTLSRDTCSVAQSCECHAWCQPVYQLQTTSVICPRHQLKLSSQNELKKIFL